MNRTDFQKLSRLRRSEARALLGRRLPAGAYYLAGYAVECALKACIARATRRYEFPDKQRVNQSHSHDLTGLLKVAGLQGELDRVSASQKRLAINWAIVKDWTSESRYGAKIDMKAARGLYKAVVARRFGVLAWLRQHW